MFDQKLKEGTITSLQAFCELRGIPYEGRSQDDVINDVETICNLEVIEDSDDGLGVEVWDHHPDSKSIRRGKVSKVRKVVKPNV